MMLAVATSAWFSVVSKPSSLTSSACDDGSEIALGDDSNDGGWAPYQLLVVLAVFLAMFRALLAVFRAGAEQFFSMSREEQGAASNPLVTLSIEERLIEERRLTSLTRQRLCSFWLADASLYTASLRAYWRRAARSAGLQRISAFMSSPAAVQPRERKITPAPELKSSDELEVVVSLQDAMGMKRWRAALSSALHQPMSWALRNHARQ
jgi:hypothetical protein